MNVNRAGRSENLFNFWRIARWTAALVLLTIPMVAMQLGVEGWHWTIGDFLVAGIVIGTVGLLYEAAERVNGNRAFRIGAAIALGASFLLVWTTLVRDDGNGLFHLEILLAGAVAAFACKLSGGGMARTMAGLSAMQALVGIAVATAPITATAIIGPTRELAYHGFFAVLWLVSAGFFWRASRS